MGIPTFLFIKSNRINLNKMPKNNKVTARVFADIAETIGRKGAYEEFLDIDHEMGLQESTTLTAMKEKYSLLAHARAEDIKALAAIEEIIIQIRSKEVIESELRLSLSRDYIYARSLFFRRGKEINDIRVVVGKVDDYGSDLDTLLQDPSFRALCQTKLIEAMDKEVEKNVKQLKLVYSE